MGRLSRPLAAGLVAVCCATSCVHLASAARPPYTVVGLVEAVDSSALTLRHKSGQRIRISVAPGTTVSRRDHPAVLTDVEVGMRIVVLYRLIDGVPVADEVRLFRDAIKSTG